MRSDDTPDKWEFFSALERSFSPDSEFVMLERGVAGVGMGI